jgi:predicted metal-dependent enzyme (double-stranded beta helix superfamily)
MSSPALRRFTNRLATIADHADDPGDIAAAAGRLLAELREFDRLLDPAERAPDPVQYRQHILHVDPSGRFSVVALVWLPGQVTAIHDHVAWCASCVIEGAEYEQRFELTASALRATECRVNERGAVSVLPPGHDIHQVRCTGGAGAISLHVYGADIARLGSSIHVTYDPRSVCTTPTKSGPQPVSYQPGHYRL